MRVLAAAFDDRAAASSALDELRTRFGLLPTDASIAPLGSSDDSRSRTVLAGRFYDDAVPAIRALVMQHGGMVVSEVDERWTQSPGLRESLEPNSAAEPKPDRRSH